MICAALFSGVALGKVQHLPVRQQVGSRFKVLRDAIVFYGFLPVVVCHAQAAFLHFGVIDLLLCLLFRPLCILPGLQISFSLLVDFGAARVQGAQLAVVVLALRHIVAPFGVLCLPSTQPTAKQPIHPLGVFPRGLQLAYFFAVLVGILRCFQCPLACGKVLHGVNAAFLQQFVKRHTLNVDFPIIVCYTSNRTDAVQL